MEARTGLSREHKIWSRCNLRFFTKINQSSLFIDKDHSAAKECPRFPPVTDLALPPLVELNTHQWRLTLSYAFLIDWETRRIVMGNICMAAHTSFASNTSLAVSFLARSIDVEDRCKWFLKIFWSRTAHGDLFVRSSPRVLVESKKGCPWQVNQFCFTITKP